MANTPLRRRSGTGSGTGTGTGTNRQRSVVAAARAAAKRAQKAHAVDGADAPGQRAFRLRRPADVSAQRAGGQDDSAMADDRADRRRPGLLSAVLALLVVAGLVAAVLLGRQYQDAERTSEARTSALAAARTAAPVILSYDYRHLDKDFAAAREHLTGTFRDRYRKTTTTVVAPTAQKYKGVVKATVAKPPAGGTPAASVVSASPDKVVVLLFMNQVTNSTQVSGPRVDLNRVRMTLVRTDGDWKVSGVDAL